MEPASAHHPDSLPLPHRLSLSRGEEGSAFPLLLTALLHTVCCCVYTPTPLKFSLSLHLLNYASLSANHGGLSRDSRSRPGFWETLTSSGPSWPQFLDILTSMTFSPPQPCTPRVTQLVHLKSLSSSSPLSKQNSFFCLPAYCLMLMAFIPQC